MDMRYAAVSRLNATSPVHILGVGETLDDARRGAFAWFGTAYEKGLGLNQRSLATLQDRMAILTEDELLAQSGVTLDDWLAEVARRGDAPGNPAAAPVAAPPREGRWSTLRDDLLLALLALIVVPLVLDVWHVARYGYVTYHRLDVIVAVVIFITVILVVVNLVRFALFKLIFGLSLREYIVVCFILQVTLRLLWEVADGNLILALLSLFLL